MATTVYGPWILAEIPSVTTALFGVAAYAFHRIKKSEDADNARRDEQLDTQATALATQSQALGILVANQPGVLVRIDRIEQRQNTLSETTASLATIIERHESWHERNDPHPARNTVRNS